MYVYWFLINFRQYPICVQRSLARGCKGLHIKTVFQWCVFFYVRLRTCAQYASMNEFTCSEHSVRIRRSKKRSTGNNPKAQHRRPSFPWQVPWKLSLLVCTMNNVFFQQFSLKSFNCSCVHAAEQVFLDLKPRHTDDQVFLDKFFLDKPVYQLLVCTT